MSPTPSVATGVPQLPTPTGVFSIIQKDRYHHSNIYSNAPMPFMQRITWSGVALHEGENIGHPASHGCIRMPHDFAAKLWVTTGLGVRVIVAKQELKPVDFADSHLFVHKDLPTAAAPEADQDRADHRQRQGDRRCRGAEGGCAGGRGQCSAAGCGCGRFARAACSDPSGTHPQRRERPTGRCRHRRQRPDPRYCRSRAVRCRRSASNSASTQSGDPVQTTGTAAATPDAPTAAESKAPAPNVDIAAQAAPAVRPRRPCAIRAGRCPGAGYRAACRQRQCPGWRFAAPNAPTLAAPTPAAAAIAPPAPAASAPAPAVVTQTGANGLRGSQTDGVGFPAAADEVVPIPPLKPARLLEAEAAAHGPIAVFISRKANKVYVRQHFAPLFDAPVTIANPDQPLGTHVFTALEYLNDGSSFRWNVVSMPVELARPSRNAERDRVIVRYVHGRRVEEIEKAASPPPPPMPTPEEVLARIDIPPDVVERISEMMVPGSSVIVSDHALGDETGDGTDFIVVTH